MENPAQGGAFHCRTSRLDIGKLTAAPPRFQRFSDGFISGLMVDAHAVDISLLIRANLTPAERLLGAASFGFAMDPAVAEELAEATLHDLSAGIPPIPSLSVREDADAWAAFASPAERKHYLVAIWRELPDADRRAFLRKAL